MTPEIFSPGIISTEKYELNSVFSPKGDEFFFAVSIPKPNHKYIIMYSKQVKGVWTKPEIATFSGKYSDEGSNDIYYSNYINAKFSEPVNIGSAINTKFGEGDTFVAQDESFLIVNSWGRPDDIGRGDLYISFKKKNGSWTMAKNMGKPVNTEVIEFCPMVSPDGKYLFFTSRKRGKADIYWVDAKIIEELKPEELKENKK